MKPITLLLRIPLLFWLILFAFELQGQTGFFNIIHPPGDNNADVIETDSSYVVFQQGNPPVNDLHLHHFTKSGSFVKSDTFSFNYFYESAVNGLCEYKGGYLKLATLYIGSDTAWVHLIHFDRNLDTIQIFNYSYLNKFLSESESVHFIPPNTIIVTGSHMAAGYRRHGLVLALDTNLQIKWERTYFPANLSGFGGFTIYDIAATSDGGLFLSGSSKLYGSTGLIRQKGLLLKVDSIGQELWREELDGPQGNHRVLVKEIDDSSAAFFTTRIDVPDSQPFTQLRFGVVDNHGIQVDTTIGGLVRNMTPDFFEWSPQIGFVGGGYAQGLGFKSYAVNINPFGSINWRREYFNGNQIGVDRGYLESMTFTQDGGMLFTGYFMNRGGGNGANIWLVKTDSWGCDTAGCHNVSVAEINGPGLAGLQLFPNPARDQVSLSLNPDALKDFQEIRVQVFSLDGRTVQSHRMPTAQSEWILDVSKLPPGTYGVAVFADEGLLGFARLQIL